MKCGPFPSRGRGQFPEFVEAKREPVFHQRLQFGLCGDITPGQPGATSRWVPLGSYEND